MSINVSVVIRAYNAERYIRGALRSVINNVKKLGERDNVEIIVGYDRRSEDNTLLVLKEFSSSNPSIFRVIEHEHMSAPEALFYCLKFVQGDYIFLLDYDDLYSKNHIERMISSMKSHNRTFSFTRIYFFENSTKHIVGVAQIPKKPYDIRNLLRYNYVSTSSICIKNECKEKILDMIKELPNAIIPFIHEDWLIALLAFKECKPLFVADSAVFYRLHFGHRSAIQDRNTLRTICDLLKDILTLLAFAKLEEDRLSNSERRALEWGLLIRMHGITASIGKHLDHFSIFRMYHEFDNVLRFILGRKQRVI